MNLFTALRARSSPINFSPSEKFPRAPGIVTTLTAGVSNGRSLAEPMCFTIHTITDKYDVHAAHDRNRKISRRDLIMITNDIPRERFLLRPASGAIPIYANLIQQIID